MEFQDMQRQQYNDGLRVNDTAKMYLLETAKWGKFLAIVGYIFIGIMLLVGFLLLMVGSSLPGVYGATGMTTGMFFAYLLIAAIYLYPVFALMKFSKLMKYALYANDEDQMADAFGHLKRVFKFMGIVAIIVLALYALAFLFFILMGVAAGVGAGM